MSKENKTIHEFDLNLIIDYFSNMQRQGVGSPEATTKALSFVDNLTKTSKIADIGCGTGSQTIVLANNTPGQITGIDLCPTFIDLFNANSQKFNHQDRVKGIVGSMDKLSFQEGELDLIWSEGAIYNIGFEKGINYWNKFLKKGGYLALTEASWFTGARPAEIEDFWNEAYPEIDTIPHCVDQIQKAGYIPIATFVLPETCWTDNFYNLQKSVQENFLKKYAGNKAAEKFVKYQRHEAELYNKYKQFYGYVFYIGQKI